MERNRNADVWCTVYMSFESCLQKTIWEGNISVCLSVCLSLCLCLSCSKLSLSETKQMRKCIPWCPHIYRSEIVAIHISFSCCLQFWSLWSLLLQIGSTCSWYTITDQISSGWPDMSSFSLSSFIFIEWPWRRILSSKPVWEPPMRERERLLIRMEKGKDCFKLLEETKRVCDLYQQEEQQKDLIPVPDVAEWHKQGPSVGSMMTIASLESSFLVTCALQLDQGLVMILGFRLAGLAVLDDGSLQAKTKIIHVCSEIEVIYWHGKSQLFFPAVRAGCYFLCAIARYSLNASTFTSNTVTVVSEILIC